MKMIKISFVACLLFLTAFVNAQYNIKWSELAKCKGTTSQIIPISGANFFTLRWQGGMLGSMYLANHSQFIANSSGKVQYVVGKSLATYEGVSAINGKVVVFLSDKFEGKDILYMQKYGTDCKQEGSAIELTSFELPNNWNKRGYFNVINSQNKEFLCVEYDIPGSKSAKQKIGYKVLTDSLEVVAEGEYESPYNPEISEISNRYLSNTGDYFFACKIYNTNERGRVKDRSTLEKAILIQVTPDGLDEFELDLDSKRIFDMGFSSDNNRIMTFTGLYGDAERGNSGIKGIFYFRLDFDKKEIIDEGFEKFSKDFITQDWSEREIERANRREANGKSAPQLFNFDIRETITLKDGSIIGMLEQYFVRQVTSNDYRSNMTSSTFYYYYNDLIVYKIQPNGTFEWVKNIPKSQVSVNDYGYYSSVASFATKDKLVIFFNDNLNNYDQKGAWNNNVYTSSFRKKTNTVAKVEIGLRDGEVERNTFFDRSETSALAVPKLFEIHYKNHEMLLYLIINRKEKFGLLNFGTN
jgi:hypothetical protein